MLDPLSCCCCCFGDELKGALDGAGAVLEELAEISCSQPARDLEAATIEERTSAILERTVNH